MRSNVPMHVRYLIAGVYLCMYVISLLGCMYFMQSTVHVIAYKWTQIFIEPISVSLTFLIPLPSDFTVQTFLIQSQEELDNGRELKCWSFPKDGSLPAIAPVGRLVIAHKVLSEMHACAGARFGVDVLHHGRQRAPTCGFRTWDTKMKDELAMSIFFSFKEWEICCVHTIC